MSKKKQELNAAAETAKQETKNEKPTPAYLRPDYPYPAVGDPITDLDSLEPTGVLYEIKCPGCEMSVRSQGLNIKRTYEKLVENGCFGCKLKEFIVRRVDMSRAEEIKAERENG